MCLVALVSRKRQRSSTRSEEELQGQILLTRKLDKFPRSKYQAKVWRARALAAAAAVGGRPLGAAAPLAGARSVARRPPLCTVLGAPRLCARPVALRGARHPPLSPPAYAYHTVTNATRVNFAAKPPFPLCSLCGFRFGSCRLPLRGSLRLAVRSARARRRFTTAHRSPPAVPPVAHARCK